MYENLKILFLPVFQLLDKGGFVIYILALLSFFVVMIACVKILQFYRIGAFSQRQASQILELYHKNHHDFSSISVKNIRSLIALTAINACLHMPQKTDLSLQKIREEITDSVAHKLDMLHRHLRFLEMIITLAPLLGLFGTVLGMIETFQTLEAAGNQINHALLSGGIWKALFTTAAGLGVAMPALVILNFFETQLERLAGDLEEIIAQIFHTPLKEQ